MEVIVVGERDFVWEINLILTYYTVMKTVCYGLIEHIPYQYLHD